MTDQSGQAAAPVAAAVEMSEEQARQLREQWQQRQLLELQVAELKELRREVERLRAEPVPPPAQPVPPALQSAPPAAPPRRRGRRRVVLLLLLPLLLVVAYGRYTSDTCRAQAIFAERSPSCGGLFGGSDDGRDGFLGGDG